MKPFFSIVTVCLNAGNTLKQTVDSVLMQSFSDFELLIKDGVSIDGSFERVPNNEKILKIQKNDYGIYDAMNQALDLVSGQYILFLNAGDFFYDSDILSSFHNCIINNNFPALVYCDYKTTDAGEFVQSPWKLSSFFLFRTMLCHQVCMVKREFYIKLGYFDTSLKVDADYDFLLRLLVMNKSSYKHIKKLGIISTSKGFSFQNSELAQKEVRVIRKKYFPNKYLVYNSLLALTLPAFRKKIANKSGSLSVIYHRLVNIFNRLFF